LSWWSARPAKTRSPAVRRTARSPVR